MIWNAANGKVLIVGASGQVGAAMCRYLQRAGLGDSVLPAARTPQQGWLTLDLETIFTPDDAAIPLETEDLSAILCIAGWTHVDGCEADPERAMQVNATGPSLLAGYAWQRNVPFVYYSTDYLFNGSAAAPGPYPEDAPVDPVNVYGVTKLAGETQVMGYHPEALIVRTAGVFGEDLQGKNFVYQVLRRLTLGQGVRVPGDQSSTPAYNEDLAHATFTLLRHGASGVYNACGPDVLDRAEFARLIAGQFALSTDAIEGVSTGTLRQPAQRPLIAGLDSSRLAREFPEARMRGVAEALQDCRPALEASMAAWRAEAARTA